MDPAPVCSGSGQYKTGSETMITRWSKMHQNNFLRSQNLYRSYLTYNNKNTLNTVVIFLEHHYKRLFSLPRWSVRPFRTLYALGIFFRSTCFFTVGVIVVPDPSELFCSQRWKVHINSTLLLSNKKKTLKCKHGAGVTDLVRAKVYITYRYALHRKIELLSLVWIFKKSANIFWPIKEMCRKQNVSAISRMRKIV